jgi:outer membrane protein assembly factor BamB/tRNA A-37 threonylcarbamoyl transferase component Bud32
MTAPLVPIDSSAQHLQPGVVLVGRYAIQDVIGVGGMGAVYRARDLHFPNVTKLVAVKEMIIQTRDPMVRDTIVQNFEREAHILVALAHPSIPKIFDYFSHDERSYLVLEYIHGKDLEAMLNEAPAYMPEAQIILWAIELCDVLDYLHSHKPEPIIFRDMKPSNIMVNQDNHIVLVDFGIAKNFRSGQKGTMIGTEGYSPPEQYRGDATPQADIYALGASMHHCLTRRDPRLEPPFTFAERPVRQINPLISAELETVINTCLQYNPADRFPTARAMKEALYNTARKNKLEIAPKTDTQFTGGTGGVLNVVKPLWQFKCEDEIRGSPAVDNNIVFVGAYDNNLYAVSAANGQFLWKFATEGGIVGQSAVNDGVVYFGSQDRNLYAVLARSGKISWTYQTDSPIRSSPSISEGHVFFGGDDSFLHAVNTITGRSSWKAEIGGAVRCKPFVTKDSIYVGSEAGEVCCVDFRGQVRWRFHAKRAVTSSPNVSQGTVFVTSLDGNFYALDAKSGWSVWRFRMAKGSVSSPCRVENLVIFGSADENIYCLDAGSSKEIWRFKTGHQVSGSPVTYKDAVYCGSADGCLYCLEYRTGRMRWKFTTNGPITGLPVIVNDVIYIGSSDKILYAIAA